jgi:predicted phage baseplate assembly protein
MSSVNANVGLATAGRSVAEVMGNGSAATPNQRFKLRQPPLTYVQAPTPSGRLSTLKVTANGVTWKEVPTLYQQNSSATVFDTMNQADATTDVLFGDGVEGATLPTGQNNIVATYRVGSGVAGNVGAGAITTLIDRPLGVSGVTNPAAATGGQDAQSINGVRANAPSSVLTLGRAVSIADYQNFAASFGGIVKAAALWIPSGPGRGVFLTVAGAGGAALPPGNPTLANLVAALQTYGNPLVPIHALSFLETLFSLNADLAYDPAYDAKAVKVAIIAALRQQYCFAARSFGQGVSGDEIAALLQAIPGVVAVNVTALTLGATSRAGDLAAGGWSV